MAEQPQRHVPLSPDERARETAIAVAQAEQDARERRADEAPEGGRFIVGGQLVDSEGRPIGS